jgi:hypothetical protein
MSAAGANEASTRVRRQKAQTRRSLRDGTLTLEQVLQDPPACFKRVPTFDVLLMLPRFGHATLCTWNASASRHGINLALPPARLSRRSKDWLIQRSTHRDNANRKGPYVTPLQVQILTMAANADTVTPLCLAWMLQTNARKALARLADRGLLERVAPGEFAITDKGRSKVPVAA